MLAVESLTKRYGSVAGAEDITFDIEAGEVFGYLGPNGSGKTTTIRCIMGLLTPSSGGCSILGRKVVPGKGTGHDCTGYLPGDLRLWDGLTARQALAFMGGLGGNGDTSGRREELAERLDLDLGRRIRNLSKGNRQKIGVINAFQNRPKVLILDEPTIGLDPLVRQTVLDLIREAAAEGSAVLLSSHDLSEVAAVCGRAAILREGRLAELASVSKIVEQGRKYLRVWFSKDGAPPAGVLERISGIIVEKRNSEMICLSYAGPVRELLSCISQYPVERIATEQTSLEEAFIQYYSGKTQRQVSK